MLISALITVAHVALYSPQPVIPLPVPDRVAHTTRVSVLGCLRQSKAAPALGRYGDHKPDVYLWVGDNIYADTKDDAAVIARCYEQLGSNPDFLRMKSVAPMIATWDDHDFGDNDETSSYLLKEQSKRMFREFWGLTKEIPEDQQGIWWSRVSTHEGNRLQVIMLDVRYQRGKPGPDADVLGETQWTWLAAQLEMPADLRLIVSGTQILLNKEAGSETWDGYPKARQRLFDLFKGKRVERSLFITGDQHYAEVARLPGAIGYDLVEIQFAGINQTEKPEFNPLRVSPCAMALHSDAMIDIQWKADEHESAHILYRVFDSSTGQVELTYRVNLSELEPAKAEPGLSEAR